MSLETAVLFKKMCIFHIENDDQSKRDKSCDILEAAKK